MPSLEAHREAVAAADRAIGQLLPNLGACAPWVAVAAFYKALHEVELLFHLDPKSRRPAGTAGHDDREYALRERRYQAVHRNYYVLKQASKVARYLESAGREYDRFDEYMTPDEVRTRLLDHHLRQLETSIANLAGANFLTG